MTTNEIKNYRQADFYGTYLTKATKFLLSREKTRLKEKALMQCGETKLTRIENCYRNVINKPSPWGKTNI